MIFSKTSFYVDDRARPADVLALQLDVNSANRFFSTDIVWLLHGSWLRVVSRWTCLCSQSRSAVRPVSSAACVWLLQPQPLLCLQHACPLDPLLMCSSPCLFIFRRRLGGRQHLQFIHVIVTVFGLTVSFLVFIYTVPYIHGSSFLFTFNFCVFPRC
jgi:hypothetical protein